MAVPLLWIALLSAAAGTTHAEPIVISQPFLAGGEDPTQGSTGWALTSHGISEKLFTVDSKGNVVPQVGQAVKKLDKFTWEVHLKADYKFSDGTPVTAALVAQALTKLNKDNSGAQASLGSMTVTALDDLKLKIASEKATPVIEAVLAEWPFVIFLEKDGKFVFTGPYAVKTFVKDDRFELTPNAHYPHAGERHELVIKRMDGDKAAVDLEAGQLDMAFHLPVDTLPKLRQADGITLKSFLAGYQYMMWHNIRKAPLSDVKVRKALDIAIDRSELTQEVRGGKGTRSFFPENTPYYLKDTELHGQKSEAAKLLDEAGWLKNGEGFREKNGVPLTLKLVAYPQRPALPVVAPVMAKRFEALGIKVNTVITSSENWDQLDKIMADKDYDLLCWAQHTLPAGDPQFFINHFFRSDGGGNHAGLNSPEIDSVIDALSHAESGDIRVQASAAAHKAILDQVPVSILYTPSWHVGLGSRMTDYEPYGSDYYVVNANFGLPEHLHADHGHGEAAVADTTSGAYRMMLSGLSVAGLLLIGLMV